MATYKHIRSNVDSKRPTTSLADGQIAINTNIASPGVFFKDSAGTGIVKVGPVHVGTTAPNSTPGAGGSTGNSKGEQWLDTSLTPAQLKVWNGSAWIGVVADELPVSKLQNGSAYQLLQTDAAGTGVEWASSIDVPGSLNVTSTAVFDSTVSHPLGSAAAPTITFTGDANTGIYSPGIDQVAITTGGTGRLYIDSSGRVGIGTSSPSSYANAARDLVIKNTTNAGITIRSGSNSDGSIYFNDTDDGNQRGIIRFNHQTDALAFHTPVGEAMRIGSSGNVGIGTSSPSVLLHVAATEPQFFIQDSNSTGNGVNATIQFRDSSNSQLSYLGFAGISDSHLSLFNTMSGGDLRFGTASTERMRIDSSGNVGINTTSANQRLNVFGNAEFNAYDGLGGTGGYFASKGLIIGNAFDAGKSAIDDRNAIIWQERGLDLVFATNDTERMRIDSSGRLLVGTSSTVDSSSTALLQVSTSGGASFALGNPNTVGAGVIKLGQVGFYGYQNAYVLSASITANSDATWSTNDYPTRLAFSTTADGESSPTERMRIDSSGVVKLTQSGNNPRYGSFEASSDAFKLKAFSGNSSQNATMQFFTGADSPTERMRIDSSGRLLVGTSSTQADTYLVVEGQSGAATGPGTMFLARGSSTPGDGNGIGQIFFTDTNHTSSQAIPKSAASIVCQRDGGTWTSGSSMPSRLAFSTTADGASSPTERMRIDSSGAVTVKRASTFTTGLQHGLAIQQGSATNGNRAGLVFKSLDGFSIAGINGVISTHAGTQANNVGYLEFYTKASGTSSAEERMRIDSSGNVGIGTSNPKGLLDVRKDNATGEGGTIAIRNTGSGIGTSVGLYLTPNTGGGDDLLRSAAIKSRQTISGNYADLGFFTADSDTPVERMTITTNGNVGIGTSSPTGKLHIQPANSDIPASALVIRQNNGANTDQNTFSVEIDPVNNVSRLISSSTNSPQMSFWTSGNERVRISQFGNVGIDAISPSQKLTVSSGNILLDSNQQLRFGTSDASFIEASGSDGTGETLYMRFAVNTERMRIDSSGRLLVGTSSLLTTYFGTSVDKLAIGGGAAPQVIGCYSANQFGPRLDFVKSRSSSVNGQTVVQSNDGLGEIYFGGSDGTTPIPAARIAVEVDGTPGANDMPGRLVFSTTADGASSPTERMRINSSGNVLVGSATTTISGVYPLQVVGDRGLVAKSTAGGANPPITAWNNENTNDATLIDFRTDTVDATRGSITYDRSAGLVSYNTTSDYRAKTLHENLQNASATVNLLNVYRGTMHGATESRPMMVAHEVQEIAPYCVTGEKDAVDGNGDPIYQSIDHSPLVPLLTAALQEALAKIEALEQRLADAGL